ncbi:hypothetical protein Mgra_00006517 [Meloidogyne graminicola]|uniref:Sex-regulated protein janus-B n=1 Tax=Meloidogyne graminicola TaxID=189291 RepID=A0A8S9ZLP0_9BILA|nr:hypothetical protein Mgra_00006517 [Meloidogyne graminicola]
MNLIKKIFKLNKMTNLASLPNVDIDEHGVFKYILIQAREGDSKKYIVRGYKACKFHANIFDKVESEESAGGLIKFECPGGGRIDHDSEKKKICVYGYSQGFGRADHTKAVDLLKKRYPDYKIDWSNDGY